MKEYTELEINEIVKKDPLYKLWKEVMPWMEWKELPIAVLGCKTELVTQKWMLRDGKDREQLAKAIKLIEKGTKVIYISDNYDFMVDMENGILTDFTGEKVISKECPEELLLKLKSEYLKGGN